MCVEKDTSDCPLSGSVSSEEIQTLNDIGTAADAPSSPAEKFRALYRLRPHIAAGVLSFGYVVNYMDRYTVAGVLADIQRHFGVSDSKSGLLPTVFICSFMVATPIFGFLGDRFNRKFILSCGIFFWSAVTLISSFITKPNFWLFLISRALVGFGEASYSTIAPTIIADMFSKDTRTCMLSFFYFAIPLGSGLGYILGSCVTQASGDWHWALRVTPAMGFAAGTLIILLVPEPKRGAAEQHMVQLRASTSWCKDMKAVIKIPSFVFSTLASASVSFATGVLGMWIPLYLFRAEVVQKNIEPCTVEPCSGRDSLIFGAITCVTGFLGLIVGVAATRWYRTKSSRADPLVCAFGMLSSSIFISLIFVFARFNIVGAYMCIFIGETLLFLNWAITADILMISDVIRQSKPDLDLWVFLSLGYALMLCPFIVVLGGTFFLATAHFIVQDRNRAHQQVEEMKLVSVKV
ncbi:protein spinster homolog 2-like isoform X2 [Carcharodon carcharias]|uniref:protein spinster homolog 2-like isoform X2 n=1 Tax=Carcharodon carcharias TaxID=13397 RepID=UPI001B7F552C|nr:protein spinster homolog 2-like isoform X2 [Carcharodon carcharias]